MSDQIVLRVTNHHAAGCGAPPRVEEQPGRYIGYFVRQLLPHKWGEHIAFRPCAPG